MKSKELTPREQQQWDAVFGAQYFYNQRIESAVGVANQAIRDLRALRDADLPEAGEKV